MKAHGFEMIRRAAGACFALAALLFVLIAPHSASAQTPSWTVANSSTAWNGYYLGFKYQQYGDGDVTFNNQQGHTNPTGFWEQVEEIEVAVDAYYWAKNNSQPNLSTYQAEINDLCQGFIDHVVSSGTKDWSADAFNDDICWAIIAFTRAYQATGTTQWLTDAEYNFDGSSTSVWKRAQPNGKTDGSDGLQQSQPHGTGWTANMDAPVNFGFVIAGYLLYNNTSTTRYKTEADAVYTWAITNLFRTNVDDGAGPGVCVGQTTQVCAKIYDSNNTEVGGGIGASDFAYNYGIAIQAATREGDNTYAQDIADWLMYNSNNPNFPYAGTYTSGGVNYNILPNYGGSGNNDAGYNGIALRGVGFGLSRGSLNSTTQLWAQANVQAAWNKRNSTGIMYQDWKPSDGNTPAGGSLYSWDCSSAISGMMNIPRLSRQSSGAGHIVRT